MHKNTHIKENKMKIHTNKKMIIHNEIKNKRGGVHLDC